MHTTKIRGTTFLHDGVPKNLHDGVTTGGDVTIVAGGVEVVVPYNDLEEFVGRVRKAIHQEAVQLLTGREFLQRTEK